VQQRALALFNVLYIFTKSMDAADFGDLIELVLVC